MKCSLCGADLIEGNNTCPTCGALNMSFTQSVAPNTPVNTQESAIEMPQMNTAVQPSTEEEEIEILDTPIMNSPDIELPAVAQVESQEGEVIDTSKGGFVDLDEGESEEVHASEDMAAPTLTVTEENLTSTVKDISDSANVSTYDPTQEAPKDEEDVDLPKESNISFTVPEIKEAEADTQGMGILQIDTKGETVGEESAPVKEKFSLKILKKKSYPRNFVFILVGVTLLIGVLSGSLLFGNKVYSPSAAAKKNTSVPHVADGKNNTTYNGKFIYKIPNQYDFDKTNGGIVIYDTNDEYKIFIRALKGSYDKIANSKESIKMSLDNIQISVGNVYETKINNNNYLVVQASTGVYNRIYAFRSYNDSYVFYVEIVKPDRTYDVNLIEIADDIINNVEYNDKYSKLELIDDEDTSSIIVAISEAKYNA